MTRGLLLRKASGLVFVTHELAALPPFAQYRKPFTVISNGVALAATGDIFSANASFVAVGWSAAGYWGVISASIALFGSLRILDIFSLRLPKNLRLGLHLMTFPAFMAMVSGSIIDFYDKGGAVALLGIVVFTLVKKVAPQRSNT